MVKTFTNRHFIALESLYKPSGYPSFELLSYLLTDDIAQVRTVLKDEDFYPERMYACGDLKEIFSNIVFRQSET